MTTTTNTKISSQEFEKYLRSIGGLTNGYTPRPKKQSNPVRYILFNTMKRMGYKDGNNPFRTKIDKRTFFNIKDGWLLLVQQCIKNCIKAGWDKELLQCKQNYGALKFRIVNTTPEVLSVIKTYENLSKKTCEGCGTMNDVVQTKGWVMSLCPICKKKPKLLVDPSTGEVDLSGKKLPFKHKYKKKFKKKNQVLKSKLTENDF